MRWYKVWFWLKSFLYMCMCWMWYTMFNLPYFSFMHGYVCFFTNLLVNPFVSVKLNFYCFNRDMPSAGQMTCLCVHSRGSGSQPIRSIGRMASGGRSMSLKTAAFILNSKCKYFNARLIILRSFKFRCTTHVEDSYQQK